MRQDLIRKLFHPSIVTRYEKLHDCTVATFTDSSCGNSKVPIDMDDDILRHYHPTTTCQHDDETENQRVDVTFDFSLDPVAAMSLSMCHSSRKDQQQQQQQVMEDYYSPPPWNYLTLRHLQNTAWAESQLELGVSYAKAALVGDADGLENNQSLVQKAEECYKKGLDMIPHHAKILTAYGALCINDGRYELAKDLLQRAIRCLQQQQGKKKREMDKSNVDADCHLDPVDDTGTLNDAKTYLTVVESKLHAKAQEYNTTSLNRKQQSVQLSNRAELVMKDVLAERAFVLGEVSHSKGLGRHKTCDDYELLSLSESSRMDNDNDGDDTSCTEKYDSDHGRSSHKKRHTARHIQKHKRKRKETTKKRHSDEDERKRKRQRSRHYEYSSDYNDDDDLSSKCSRSSVDTEDDYGRKRRHSRRKHGKKKKKKKQKRRR